ncbi:MAG: hypothetical protein EOO60_01815 [Hymenobacter sp.]|nr:MAG: hypothetical protein EOO60_01815 [Hymenobacter sp.]
MNSKRSVYLLVPLVLLVWGLIGWRIWAAANDSTSEAEQLPTVALRAKPTTVRHQPKLLLAYDDPFKPGPSHSTPSLVGSLPAVGTLPNAATSGRSAASLNFAVRPAVPTVAIASVPWPQIRYLGVIAHAGGSAQVALLAIDNQEFVIKASKSERGVQVLKLFRDSVQLGFSGQKKSFVRSMASEASLLSEGRK